MDIFLNVYAVFFFGVELLTLFHPQFWLKYRQVRKRIDGFYVLFIFIVGILWSWSWTVCFILFSLIVGYIASTYEEGSLSWQRIERVDATFSILFLLYFLFRGWDLGQELAWIVGWLVAMILVVFWQKLDDRYTSKGFRLEDIEVGSKYQRLAKLYQSLGWLMCVFALYVVLRGGSVWGFGFFILGAWELYKLSQKMIEKWRQALVNHIRTSSKSEILYWY